MNIYQDGMGQEDKGLTVYIAIAHKKEIGCDIKKSACGKSGLILCHLWVKLEEDLETSLTEVDYVLDHVNKVITLLVLS